MSLSVEELLRPRYKVIADWPECEFTIGQILEFTHKCHWVLDLSEKPEDVWQSDFIERKDGSSAMYSIKLCEPYPHLFQKLEWHQDRTHEELPEYLKRDFNGRTYVYKKEFWQYSEDHKGIKYTTSDGIGLLNHISTCEIATLEEYNQYQSSIKHL